MSAPLLTALVLAFIGITVSLWAIFAPIDRKEVPMSPDDEHMP